MPRCRTGAPLAAHQVAPQHFAREGDAYRFGIAPFKVEMLTRISGISFDQALEGARTFELNGRAVPYIGGAALIRNKRSAGRHKYKVSRFACASVLGN